MTHETSRREAPAAAAPATTTGCGNEVRHSERQRRYETQTSRMVCKHSRSLALALRPRSALFFLLRPRLLFCRRVAIHQFREVIALAYHPR